jgi:hypothetical protein
MVRVVPRSDGAVPTIFSSKCRVICQGSYNRRGLPSSWNRRDPKPLVHLGAADCSRCPVCVCQHGCSRLKPLKAGAAIGRER